MSKIIWNTDVDALGCPGEIVNEDGQAILIQTDWEYPPTAQTFGWSLKQVQKCPCCGKITIVSDDDDCCCASDSSECRVRSFEECEHDGTDGTVACEDCGVTAGDFISAAGDWLRDNDGAEADDPGYFNQDPPGDDDLEVEEDSDPLSSDSCANPGE